MAADKCLDAINLPYGDRFEYSLETTREQPQPPCLPGLPVSQTAFSDSFLARLLSRHLDAGLSKRGLQFMPGGHDGTSPHLIPNCSPSQAMAATKRSWLGVM